MAHFEISRDGESLTYSKSDAAAFADVVRRCVQHGIGYVYTVAGKSLTADEAIDAADAVLADKLARKNLTHDRVTVRNGVSPFAKPSHVWISKKSRRPFIVNP